MKVLFFGKESQDVATGSDSLEESYTYTLWQPTIGSVVPREVPKMPFVIWWAMHYLRMFGNRDYGLFVVYSGDTLVHRSCVFPRYFRFPFMGKDDLQICDTW